MINFGEERIGMESISSITSLHSFDWCSYRVLQSFLAIIPIPKEIGDGAEAATSTAVMFAIRKQLGTPKETFFDTKIKDCYKF